MSQRFRRSCRALVLTPLLAICVAGPLSGNDSDPRAVEIANATMEAMGGREAFAAVSGVRFDFAFSRDGQEVGRFEHTWNRDTGDYLVVGTDRETGAPYTVRFNVDTRGGSATVDGVELDGEALAERLESAYGRYINDTYWFLMPWKWLDPGVTLTYEGEREIDGEACDVVQLTFDEGIGLTSNDRYWGYVSKKTGLLTRWEYVLQDKSGQPGTGKPTVWSWGDWKETAAGVLVSKTKRRVADGPAVAISFPVLELSTSAPDEPSSAD